MRRLFVTSVAIRDITRYDGPLAFLVEGLLTVLDDEKYMNYDRYTKDPKNSALFNGNATSMGGNGLPDPKYTGLRTGTGTIKPGGGGGCVVDGPFTEFVPSSSTSIHCHFRYLTSFLPTGTQPTSVPAPPS